MVIQKNQLWIVQMYESIGKKNIFFRIGTSNFRLAHWHGITSFDLIWFKSRNLNKKHTKQKPHSNLAPNMNSVNTVLCCKSPINSIIWNLTKIKYQFS